MSTDNYQLHPTWQKFPLIEDDLLRVKMAMADKVKSPNEEVNQCLKELCLGQAKLIRPALMILVARCFCGNRPLDDRFIHLAATLEMLHLATLVHDDIIDDAPKRRGVVSLHERVGRQVAVYSGDYLLCQVFSGILKYCGGSLEEAEFITATIEEILEGELKQRTFEGDFSVSEESYLDIIKGKTAKLIALFCIEGLRAGTQIGEFDCSVNEGIECEVWNFGESLGIAYQIIDDNLDFDFENHDGKQLGKPVNQDFKEGHFTLPVIFSISKYRDELKRLYQKECFTMQDATYLRNIVQVAGGLEYSKKVADEFTAQAMDSVKGFPSSIYKEYLEKLVQLLLMRSC